MPDEQKTQELESLNMVCEIQCGCQVFDVTPDNDLHSAVFQKVVFCPLHAAALEMLEMLKGAISQVEDNWHELDDEGIPICEICEVYLGERHTCFVGACQALIEKVEGEGEH